MVKLTKKDISDAARELVEKEYTTSVSSRVQKKLNEGYEKPEEFYETCPYCNKQVYFPNSKKFIIEDKIKCIQVSCPECYGVSLISLMVHEKGDMFAGYDYIYDVKIKKMEKAGTHLTATKLHD